MVHHQFFEQATIRMPPHQTDAGREWPYDRKYNIGQLDKALDEAQAKDWTVVDMKK